MKREDIRNTRKSGMILPLAIVVAVVGGIVILTIAKIVMTSTHQTTYIIAQNNLYKLAETGRNKTLGALVSDPNLTVFGPESVPEQKGEFESVIYKDPAVGGNINYYVVTSATRTIGEKSQFCRIHSYVRLANISGYFAAINDSLSLSHPVDLGNGKIYGTSLRFENDLNPATKSILRKAEFLNTCDPAIDWSPGLKADIVIAEPANNQPVKLNFPLLLPQVLEFDIAQLKTLAGPHTQKNVFTGDIFPPGYAGSQHALDTYDLHTANNFHHIYFSTNVIYIEGTVHGQVIFVSTQNIVITSSVVSSLDSYLPGEGQISSSTAHQAVFITRNEVIVSTNFYSDPTPPAAPITQFIQGMILAPNGTFRAQPYADDTVHDNLKLDFDGAMILGTLQSLNSFPKIFKGGRRYQYMDSLLTNPPPFIPPYIEITYSFEEPR